MHDLNPNQKGSILIVALLVLALVEVVLVSLIGFQQFGILFTKDIKAESESRELLLGGEKWVAGLLKQIEIEGLRQPVYQLPPTETPYGTIYVKVIDAQSLVNLNDLSRNSSRAVKLFLDAVLQDNFPSDKDKLMSIFAPNYDKELLEATETTKEDSPKTSQDKTQTQSQPQSSQEDTSDTAAQPENFFASAQEGAYFSITQLLTTTEITGGAFKALWPYVTALPESVGINVNTASPEVLYSLSPKMNASVIDAILQARQSQPIDSYDAWESITDVRKMAINSRAIAFKSQYYLDEITVKREDQTLKLYNLMKVTSSNAQIMVQVLWRSFGTP